MHTGTHTVLCTVKYHTHLFILIVTQTFPGTPTEGCMSLEVTGVIYHIQMSAVAIVNGERLEGTLSSITGESTVYVPPPGMVC